jgi:hypothetical protein
MKISIPITNRKLTAHLGHCEESELVDVNKPTRTMLVFSLIGVLLVGCCSSPEPQKKSLSEQMTPWGPALSKEEEARIATLSTAELVDMARTGDMLHKHTALSRLKANGGSKDNFDVLLSIATEKHGFGDMIVEGLVPAIDQSASAEDKRRVDKFMDFLEAQLKSNDPSVRHTQAVRSLGQTINSRKSLPPLKPESLGGKRKKPPYGYARVMGILIRCLDDKDRNVRDEAIEWLGSLGAQDPVMGKKVVTILEAQLAKEEASAEKKTVKEELRRGIEQSLETLRMWLASPGSLYDLYDNTGEH